MIPDEQLDFEACVGSGQVFRFRLEEGVWRGVDGENLIEARRVPGGWDMGSSPDEGAWGRFLQIDLDLPSIQRRLVEAEPRMAPLVENLPGLRTLRPQSAVETLFSFLCTPNNHMSRIVKMTAYLASKGEELALGHFRFPGLERIADLSEAELRENGFGYRAATIPRVAQQVLSKGGEAWLEGLKAGTYEEARVELLGLGSVGPKLADCICLFGLHFDAAVPIDTHVWKACQEWYLPESLSKGLTPQRYEESRRCFGERFGDLAGWAQQYVFYERFLSYRRTKVGF